MFDSTGGELEWNCKSAVSTVVTPPGLEPGTNGLKVRCSAIELEGQASVNAPADATANRTGPSSRFPVPRCYRARLVRCGARLTAAPAARAERPSNISKVMLA